MIEEKDIEVIAQFKAALDRIAVMPKALKLVVVIGPSGSGKNTLIRYCCGQNYKENDEYQLLTTDGSILENSSIEIFSCENIVFFRWRLFKDLSDIEHTAEQFLLSYLLKLAHSVAWLGAIDYNSVDVGYGSKFKAFYADFSHVDLITPEVKASVRWIATCLPHGGVPFFSKHLLKACQRYVPNCFSQMTDLFITNEDGGQSREKLLRDLKTSSLSPMSLPLVINEYAVTLLSFALSEPQYASVAEFFLDAIDVLDWLQYGLATQNASNDVLVEQLVRRLMLLRMADPYDNNYQHRVVESHRSLVEMIGDLPDLPGNAQSEKLKQAGLLLERYNNGTSNFKENELLTLCHDLNSSETPHSAQPAEVEVLSQGVQAALVTRYNQHILETEDLQTEQDYFESQLALKADTKVSTSASWNSHLSVFNNLLSTFKMIGLLKSSDVELMQKTISQFNHFVNEQWDDDSAKSVLKYLCTLLSSLDTGVTLEKAYLRPLLYLMDEDQKTIPHHEKLPLSYEKLVALKQLYQTVMRLYELQILQQDELKFISFYTVAAGKIVQSLLVLTDTEALLSAWLSDLLLEKNDNTAKKVIDYFSEKVDVFKSWMVYAKELGQWMNSAAFQVLNSSLDEAKESVFQAMKTIIIRMDGAYNLGSEVRLNESVDRDAIMQDIERYVDLSQMNASSGFIRHYPLLIIVSHYYERKALTEPFNYVLSLAFVIRLLHQLSAVRNMSELFCVLEEFKEPLAMPILSGQLGQLPQIVAFCGIISTVLVKLRNATDKVDFSKKLISEIEHHLPSKFIWSETLIPWLSAAKIVLTGYQSWHVEPEGRLLHLKAQEKEIKQQEKFAEEGQTALRLLVSAQYLSNVQFNLIQTMQTGNWQQRLSEILTTFVEPLVIIWEQHEITATVIFAPHLLQAVSGISALSREKLSIENCFEPILNVIQNTHKIFEQRQKNALLIQDSSQVCLMVHALNNYLIIAHRLHECYQTGKMILTKLKSLQFCQKRLEEMGTGSAQLVAGSINKICCAIQSGDLDAANATIQQSKLLFNQVTSAPGSMTTVVANASGSAVSCATVLGTLNLVASVANIAVTVYYGQKIMAKVNEIEAKVDGLGEQQKQLMRYAEETQLELQKIFIQIDRRLDQLDQNISFFRDEMVLSVHQLFHQMEFYQDRLLTEMKKEFKELHDNIEFGRLKNNMLLMIRRSEMLVKACKQKNFSESKLDEMNHISLDLLSFDTGLSSPEFNGKNTNPNLVQRLFFLQPLFEKSKDNLPNLIVWMQSCLAFNNFLKGFFEYSVVRKIPLEEAFLEDIQDTYSKIIEKTFQILQTLNTTTTAPYILNLMIELKKYKAITHTNQYEHIHLIAQLCGFPLHQFGEIAFELWKIPEEALNETQQRKDFLEKTIIQVLGSILSSPDSPKPCSRFVLSVQNLLRELMEVGMCVFPTLLEEPIIKNICGKLRWQLQERVLISDLEYNLSEVDELLSERSMMQCYNTPGIGLLGAPATPTPVKEHIPMVTMSGAFYER